MDLALGGSMDRAVGGSMDLAARTVAGGSDDVALLGGVDDSESREKIILIR